MGFANGSKQSEGLHFAVSNVENDSISSRVLKAQSHDPNLVNSPAIRSALGLVATERDCGAALSPQ